MADSEEINGVRKSAILILTLEQSVASEILKKRSAR
jgi:flagellar motor switch protein FliG